MALPSKGFSQLEDSETMILDAPTYITCLQNYGSSKIHCCCYGELTRSSYDKEIGDIHYRCHGEVSPVDGTAVLGVDPPEAG